MNIRDLYNLISTIPEAGLAYLVHQMDNGNSLTKDDQNLLIKWITKHEKTDRTQPIREILLALSFINIKYINNATENEQLKVVYHNPLLIESIDSPNENVQMAAVNHPLVKSLSVKPHQIFNRIAHPCDGVWKAVIVERPGDILNLMDPSVELQKAAVEIRPDLVSRSTPFRWADSVIDLAFELDKSLFTFLRRPTDQQCWDALQHDPFLLNHIRYPTEEMKAYAVLVT